MKQIFLVLIVCTACQISTVCISVPIKESLSQIIIRILKGHFLAPSHYVTLSGEECL